MKNLALKIGGMGMEWEWRDSVIPPNPIWFVENSKISQENSKILNKSKTLLKLIICLFWIIKWYFNKFLKVGLFFNIFFKNGAISF